MRPPFLYLAEVEWVDSVGGGDWQEEDHAKGLLDQIACSAVGFVLVDDKRGITLALGMGDAGIVLDSMAIPRAAITAVHKLKREKS